jgi:hypothetical protein
VLFDSNGEIDSMDIHQEIYKEDHVITDLNKVPEVIFATSACNKVYPKKFFSYLNFPDSMLYEDNIVSIKILLNSSKVVVTTDSIYYYRHGENDSSISQSVSKRNCVDLLKSNTQLLNLKNDYPNYSKLLYFLTLHFSHNIIFWLMNFSFSLEDKKEIYNSLKVFLNLIPNDIFIEFKNIFPNYISTENDLLNIKKMDFYEYLVKYHLLNYLDSSFESVLYVDTGNGFNESDKVTMSYQMDDIIDLTFDLKKFKKIKNLRFDPLEFYFCKCSLISINSNFASVNVVSANSANSLKDKFQIFTTLDPQYLLKGDFNDINFINLKFKVKILSNAEIGKQFILKDKEIEEKDNIITEKNFKIEEMSSSNSWKITKPIRSVKKTLKK